MAVGQAGHDLVFAHAAARAADKNAALCRDAATGMAGCLGFTMKSANVVLPAQDCARANFHLQKPFRCR
jgi:hypothetical protein